MKGSSIGGFLFYYIVLAIARPRRCPIANAVNHLHMRSPSAVFGLTGFGRKC